MQTLPFCENLRYLREFLFISSVTQGTIKARFTLDIGAKKHLQNGKGEIFANATDLLNTMNTRTQIKGNNFNYTSANYYEL